MTEARLVESEAIGDTTATVMPRNREARKAELFHDDHHVARHSPLRIGRMIRGGGGTPAAAVAAKVSTDDRKAAGQ